jgi:hypothetical protein
LTVPSPTSSTGIGSATDGSAGAASGHLFGLAARPLGHASPWHVCRTPAAKRLAGEFGQRGEQLGLRLKPARAQPDAG